MSQKAKAVSLGGRGRYEKLAPGAQDGTPERLAKAAAVGAVKAEAGVRRLADPFDKMRSKQALDRDDKRRNDALWEAGDRFRHHWHRSRLDGLAAFDFSRESVDGSRRPDAATPTEAALRHREAHRRAVAAVGPRLLPFLNGVVIEGRPAAALLALVTDTRHARTAEAIVIERLREALHRLADHWTVRPNLRPRERSMSG